MTRVTNLRMYSIHVYILGFPQAATDKSFIVNTIAICSFERVDEMSMWNRSRSPTGCIHCLSPTNHREEIGMEILVDASLHDADHHRNIPHISLTDRPSYHDFKQIKHLFQDGVVHLSDEIPRKGLCMLKEERNLVENRIQRIE